MASVQARRAHIDTRALIAHTRAGALLAPGIPQPPLQPRIWLTLARPTARISRASLARISLARVAAARNSPWGAVAPFHTMTPACPQASVHGSRPALSLARLWGGCSLAHSLFHVRTSDACLGVLRSRRITALATPPVLHSTDQMTLVEPNLCRIPRRERQFCQKLSGGAEDCASCWVLRLGDELGLLGFGISDCACVSFVEKVSGCDCGFVRTAGWSGWCD